MTLQRSRNALLVALLFSAFSIVGEVESSMIRNVLFSYPLLVYLGWSYGAGLGELKTKTYLLNLNASGATAIVIASFSLAFWMIPRWMDAAVTEPLLQVAKHLSLFFLVGLPLGYSWRNTNFIIRGFVKIEFLSMLLRLGWLYVISPVRLCNNYSLDEQYVVGQSLLWLALALALYYIAPLFINTSKCYE